MPFNLQLATPADAVAIAALRNAVAENLTARYGKGHWSGCCTERGVLWDMKTGRVYVARRRNKIIATLRLSTRKPWAIDVKYFSACTKPLYLTAMAVAPDLQKQGIGRLCIEEAKRLAKAFPADAIRLDAYDAEAGAGEFYAKCGFREVARVKYKGTPLIYFEMLIGRAVVHSRRREEAEMFVVRHTVKRSAVLRV